MISQTANRIHVTCVRLNIMANEITIPRSGTRGTSGVSERSRKLRAAATNDPYSCANDDESQQRAYAHHLGQHINGQGRSQHGDENANGQSGNPRCSETRMDSAEHGR